MARRRTPKLKLNLPKLKFNLFGAKPKKSSNWVFGWKDQRGNSASSRKYDLMRFPQY
jgi:hypothetical protein